MPRLIISSAWSHQVDGKTEFDVQGNAFEQVIRNFAGQFPVLRHRLTTDDDRLYTYYNVVIDGKMVPRSTLSSISIADTCRITIIPPMAGG